MLVAIIFKGYGRIGTILTRTENDERGRGRRNGRTTGQMGERFKYYYIITLLYYGNT